MSVNINGERFTTFADYINDESKVSKSERSQVEYEATLIGEIPNFKKLNCNACHDTNLILKI